MQGTLEASIRSQKQRAINECVCAVLGLLSPLCIVQDPNPGNGAVCFGLGLSLSINAIKSYPSPRHVKRPIIHRLS